MELLGRIIAIPALILSAMLAIAGLIAAIFFHEAITAGATALFTIMVNLVGILSNLVGALAAAIQKG